MSIASFGLIERDGEILFSTHVTCQEVSFTCFLLILIHSLLPLTFDMMWSAALTPFLTRTKERERDTMAGDARLDVRDNWCQESTSIE
jgi:hypothetical protein